MPVCQATRTIGVVGGVLSAIVSVGQRAAGTERQPEQAGGVRIGGVEYRRLATRQETEQRMLALLRPERVRWGTWHAIGPFAWGRRGPRLADPGPVEAELAAMVPGGPGPDLTARHEGKNGEVVAWRALGDIRNRAVDLRTGRGNASDEFVCVYLYGTVEVDAPTSVEVALGSDDGLRFWINGRLTIDADVERGLDPEAHRVRLDLQRGVNHLLAKVSQGRGAFEFQITTAPPLDPLTDAQLRYLLDRDFPMSAEDRYYRALTIPVPAGVVLEVGGLDVLPPDARGQGRPIVGTRRGEVYIVEGAYEDPPFNVRFRRFAWGLHEPLGLAVRVERGPDGRERPAVYCAQRGELTRLVDEDGDEVADRYETVCDAWGVSGNYHEFAFGPKFDRAGHAWVTLNVGFCGSLGKSVVPYRGWAVRIAPDGTMTPVCDGLRSPNGIGMFSDGAMFYLDNQGDYVGTNRMTLLAPGSWAGHPSTLRWRTDWKPGDPPPPRQRASIWFPYRKMGQSAADFLLYEPDGRYPAMDQALSGGAFGPFRGQVFVGDQTLCLVMRVYLEQVEGMYQGACIPFRQGLDCGVNRLAWGSDGSMFVGMTDRGWSSTGRLRYGLQRLVWTGQVPFELQAMRVVPDGFVLSFTRDVDVRSAEDTASYAMTSYTYLYHEPYGSPEIETEPVWVTSATAEDARTVRLRVDRLRGGGEGYVHELWMRGLRAADGEPLLHPVAYYTLQRVPGRVSAQTR